MAAAYAALVSLYNNLEDITNHPRHSFSFDKNQIQSLVESVTFLIEFMESYDNCHHVPSKDAAQLLERRITCAAHAAEQVIESHVVHQVRDGSTLGGKKRSPRFLLDLEKVIQDMDYVRRKAIKVHDSQGELELKQATYSSSTPTISEKNTATMVGFDDLLLQLLDVLTGHPSSRRVIPIVGTGGVGKTTLARNAFEHSFIVQHFDVCLWATISQQYVVKDILLKLLSGQGKSSSETLGDLGEQLHKMLYGRRYLIVLDDMWSVTPWDKMKFVFPDTNNGSRIVVTTRQSDVAYHLNSSSSLEISLLDDDKSWDLFCEKTFAGGGCPPELEDVGKNIVRKCKGLPLAIVVVAGHLRKSSQTKEWWENVANNMKSILNSKENKHFFNILSFSYIHLPVHLKPCFIYMGTFPEDKDIYVPDLIRRWIAEGFLKPCKGNNLEEIALVYLKDLIGRNLILDSTSEQGSYCKIHDVLRELCLKVAEKEMFFHMLVVPQASCRGSRVGIKESMPLVRSIRWEYDEEWSDLIMCRVLHKFTVFTNEVDGGIHDVVLHHVNLRYLNIDYGVSLASGFRAFYTIPSSIFLLWNLQTLIIGGRVASCVDAPNEIWEMIQLRHLQVLRGGIHLPDDPLPSGIVMGNLQTLLGVSNFKFSEEVCKRVPNIKELKVNYSGEVRLEHYCPHNLGCVHRMESLELSISLFSSGWREFVLRLTFPSSLKKLRLRNTDICWEEMTVLVGSLPNLETLHLDSHSIIGSEWTFVEGKFLGLKSLTIAYCSDVVHWNLESSHFPVLEKLHLENLYNLHEFPSDIGTIPTLQSITLVYCHISFAISAVRMLVEQEEENGNEGLRLYVHFSSVEEVESFNKEVQEEGLTTKNLISSRRRLKMF